MDMNGKLVRTMLKIKILGVQFVQKKELTLDMQKRSYKTKNQGCGFFRWSTYAFGVVIFTHPPPKVLQI